MQVKNCTVALVVRPKIWQPEYVCFFHLCEGFKGLFVLLPPRPPLPSLSLSQWQSLVLLEYLLKTGADGVATASVENVHVVKALTEFKFIDKDGKDQVQHM